MHVIRFTDGSTVHCGLHTGDGAVTALPDVHRMAELLALPAADFRTMTTEAAARPPTHQLADVALLPPVDGRTEVWAAGVTYERSRDARVEESTEQSVYERVYDAARPELFFKSAAWRVVTDNQPIAIREDSALNVPEPELGVVINANGEIVGYVVVNDVSSRTIEGENPLYLPQAKIYSGACAISTGIRPAWEIPDARALDITLVVRRGPELAYQATISTARLHRIPTDLTEYLYRDQSFPDGAVLSTGTGIVPDIDFTLRVGDTVEIDITDVGRLTNRVGTTTEATATLNH